MIFSVNSALRILQKNYSISTLSSVTLLYVQLNQIETIEEINQNFFKAFEDVSNSINNKKSLKHEELVNKINDIIQKNYMNQALSVESIADERSMSPTYIGRLYKQNTLNTILDSIINARMSRARALLMETEFPIAKIANLTGFSDDSYFYKTFKKENGITPSDYRKNTSTLT